MTDQPAWRPADEAEATSNIAVFVEWLRATSGRPNASPADVRQWRSGHPEAFLQAVADFMGQEAVDAGRAERLLVDDERPG